MITANYNGLTEENHTLATEPNHPEIEQHIQDGNQEALLNSLSKVVDQSTHPDANLAEQGIHTPSSKAPSHWYRSKLNRWTHTHLVPEGFKKAIEKKFGNFVVLRSTGKIHYEEMPVYTRIGMHLLFGGYYRDKVVDTNLMHNLFMKETLRQGLYFNQPESVKQIPSFIEHYSIDMNDYIKSNVQDYQNFNEFFSRAILPKKRPIAEEDDPNVIVSSADCRLNVFDNVNAATTFWIKGKQFTLENLFKDKELAQELEGGSLAIFRLAPQDYHRFHIPAKGKIESITSISGTYYTVNPCTINEDLNVFTDNHRSIVKIESHHGFRYSVVSIGALLVGSIVFTNAEENRELEKGQEMGYFQYGGSTVIAVFPKDTVTWDADLKKNSEQSMETVVLMGDRIGAYSV